MFWKRFLYILTAVILCLAAGGALNAKSHDSIIVCDDVADPMTLDPHKQFSEKNHTICQQIFDGLVRFGPDGKIEPALAVSWERTAPDRMRFKLRKGVSFHNGEPFNSQSAVFSIGRYLDPATGFPALDLINSISRAEPVDDFTVDIITKYPDGLLLNRLAGFVLMAPPLYIKEKGDDFFAANPIGTGAFIFKEWKRGEKIVLSANKNYWLKGYPKANGLEFKFIPLDEQVKALLDGEINLLIDMPGTQTLSVMKRPGLVVVKKPCFRTIVPCLNLSSGPLSSADVRRALNYAIDKNDLIRYDLLGNGWPMASLSMDGETGHNKSLMPYPYNPEKAKKLLASAGYSEGFVLKTIVKRNSLRTAGIIATQLKKIGVILNFTPVSDGDMLSEFSKKEHDMGIGDSSDPMYHLFFNQALILYSKSPFCLGGIPEYDTKFEKLVSIIDAEEHKKTAEELDKYVHDNALSLFTYHKLRLYGMDKRVNFTSYLSGMPYFFESYLSEKEKQ